MDMSDTSQQTYHPKANSEKKRSVEELRRRLMDDAHIERDRLLDNFLESHLRAAGHDIEKAYSTVKFYFEVVRQHPKFFPNAGPMEKKFMIEMDFRQMLYPACDKDGRPIMLAKVGNVDMDLVSLEDVIAVDEIWLEYILLEYPEAASKGLCVIIDVKDYPLRMVKWHTPENNKISMKKINSLPFKDFRFHIVNSATIVNVVIKLIWPFLPEHIKETVVFHFNNRDSLHKYIEPEYLPHDYGGTLGINLKQMYNKLYKRNDEILDNFLTRKKSISK